MDELVESILDYIRKPYTDHAIMVNGEVEKLIFGIIK